MNDGTFHDSETPAEGQQVFTACAFIHSNFNGINKVFLPKRAKTKKFLPGVYELPGGHIDFGEDLIDGLKREIKEEFESEINVGDLFYVFTYNNELKGSHSIELIYFARFITPIDSIILHADDHSEFLWLDEQGIDRIIDDHKCSDDSEILAIRRGFSLLKGSPINFG